MEIKKRFTNIELRYAIGFAITIAIQLGVIYLIKSMGWQESLSSDAIFLLEMLPMMLIGYGIFGYIVLQVPTNIEIEKHKLSVGQILLLFTVAWSGLYFSNLVGTLITNLIGILLGHPIGNVVMSLVTGTSVPVQIGVAVILAPICEELLFRKLLLDRVAGYGEKTAVILSATLFALFHGNIGQAVYAFTLGALFSVVYLKTGEIKYTIILHAMVNFVGSVVAGLIIEKTNILDIINQIAVSSDPVEQLIIMSDNAISFLIYAVYLVCVLAVVVVGAITFFRNTKKLSFVSKEGDIPKGEIFKTVYLNYGMLVWIVICLTLVIRSLIIG